MKNNCKNALKSIYMRINTKILKSPRCFRAFRTHLRIFYIPENSREIFSHFPGIPVPGNKLFPGIIPSLNLAVS